MPLNRFGRFSCRVLNADNDLRQTTLSSKLYAC